MSKGYERYEAELTRLAEFLETRHLIAECKAIGLLEAVDLAIELIDHPAKRIEEASARPAIFDTAPPVVGNRFRRRDGSEVIIVVAVLSSGRVMYTDGAGDCYDPDGGCYGPTGHDLIEDLGPAGGEA